MNNSKHHLSTIGFIICLTGAILFSTKAIMVKLAFQETKAIDAVSLLFFRMLFSLPFYAVVGFWHHQKNKVNQQPIILQQWFYIAILGILGYYLSSLLDFIGLKYISAGMERLILFLYPTFSVIINRVVYKTKLTSIQLLALLLTYAGIAFAYWGELKIDTANPNFYFGSLMIFLCAITYSFYLVGAGRMIKHIGDTRFTVYAMLFATGGVLLHFLDRENFLQFEISKELLFYSILLALVATVVPSFLLSNAMKKIGSNNVSIISSIGPVSTIIQAHFILREQITSEQLGGTILVIAGVLLTGWKTNS